MKTILGNILGDVNREVKGGHIPSEIKPHIRLSFPPGIKNSDHPRAVCPIYPQHLIQARHWKHPNGTRLISLL